MRSMGRSSKALMIIFFTMTNLQRYKIMQRKFDELLVVLRWTKTLKLLLHTGTSATSSLKNTIRLLHRWRDSMNESHLELCGAGKMLHLSRRICGLDTKESLNSVFARILPTGLPKRTSMMLMLRVNLKLLLLII